MPRGHVCCGFGRTVGGLFYPGKRRLYPFESIFDRGAIHTPIASAKCPACKALPAVSATRFSWHPVLKRAKSAPAALDATVPPPKGGGIRIIPFQPCSGAFQMSLDPARLGPMANAIRALAMDAVQAANSGHPGMPMGMADVATVLFQNYLKFDPADPKWADRDRFVLSAGHGSMLQYSALYLTGYARPTLQDIKDFRQIGSPCAGHPENFELEGVECTTGPLGQGFAMAVGFAAAERHLNAIYGDDLVDHRTWVIAGDGCLMEGINHEAIGLAGHLNLGRLIVLWDDNKITIDGAVSLSSNEDIPARYRATGWHVVSCEGHDPVDIA